jgi:hypothetical protein
MLTDEIQAKLHDDGHGRANVNLFYGDLPGALDDAVGIYEYAGLPPENTKNSPEPYMEKPRFQVLSRSKSYSTARKKAEAIYRGLHGFSGKIKGVHYARIRALQAPFDLGSRDNSGRVQIVCNYEAWKQQSPLT